MLPFLWQHYIVGYADIACLFKYDCDWSASNLIINNKNYVAQSKWKHDGDFFLELILPRLPVVYSKNVQQMCTTDTFSMHLKNLATSKASNHLKKHIHAAWNMQRPPTQVSWISPVVAHVR